MAVRRIHENQARLMVSHIPFVNLGKRGDNQQVAYGSAPRGRTIHRNHARATHAFNGISDEPLAVVDIPYVDLFVLKYVGRIQQVFVDGAGSFVM